MSERARRIERVSLSTGLVGAAALIVSTLLWSRSLADTWAGPAECALVAALLSMAALAGYGVIRDEVRPRIWAATLLALAPGLELVGELSGLRLEYPLWEDRGWAILIALGCTVGAIGLLYRRSWARWMALAGAAAGLGTAGLNGIGTLLAEPGLDTWKYALVFSFSATVGLALVGPSVRAEFEAEGADGIWSARDPVVRWIRWSVLSTLVAAPMLVTYAWVQPIVAQTEVAAFVLAIVLGVGAVLCMARKVLGAVLLTLAGPALLVLTAVTAWLAHGQGMLDIAGYYACFWVPAGVVSTIAGFMLAKPLVGLLRAPELQAQSSAHGAQRSS